MNIEQAPRSMDSLEKSRPSSPTTRKSKVPAAPNKTQDKKLTLPLLRDDEAHGRQRREHHDQRFSMNSIIMILRRYVLMLINIAAWYTTNGMNGISMQSFASQQVANADDFTKSAVTVFVTALQLLLGALLGRTLLYVYCNYIAPTEEPRKPIDFWKSTTSQTILAGLHAVGSTCTNLGFINGKASLVQVIKLFEPFETLFFTKLLVKEEGDLFTTGVISSMCLTLGAALSLLPTKSKQNPSYVRAIVFATFSGLSLSLRNVLQRRQHASQQDFSHVTDKLEKSLILFTQVSLHSGRLLIVVAVLLLMPSLLSGDSSSNSSSSSEQPLAILLTGLNVGLLSWHPLYNVFSMITLGFVSAVTHSLLNAGKRVYAILMAILWFSEAFTSKTVKGLLLVTVGGCWYAIEMKAAKSRLNAVAVKEQQQLQLPSHQQQVSSLGTKGWWVKPLIVAALLQMDFYSFSSEVVARS